MAENTESQNKEPSSEDKDSSQDLSGPESSEDRLEAEAIEALLHQEDPEFAASLVEIKEDKDISLKELEEIPEPGLKYRLRHFFRACYIYTKNFLYYIVNHLIAKFQKIKKHLKSLMQSFGQLSGAKKIIFLILLAGFVLSLGLVYLSLTKGFLPKDSGLYLSSLESVATKSYDVTESESFYDNVRVSFYLLQLPKVIVNLKKSENSAANPMGAFEFMVQGLSADVLLEIKQREVEFKDSMQRNLENITYDEALSTEGKKRLCNMLLEHFNQQLKTGKIKKVLIKNIILKP